MSNSSIPEQDNSLIIEKRIARFLLKAGLFWNNKPAHEGFVSEDGIFYWHNSVSSSGEFFEFLESVGVLLQDGQRGFRLAIRPDAMALYADYLIEKGLQIEAVINALVCIGGQRWLDVSRNAFPAKVYHEAGGTTSFDCRQLMSDLVALGYAEMDNNLYRWTSKMEPILRTQYF